MSLSPKRPRPPERHHHYVNFTALTNFTMSMLRTAFTTTARSAVASSSRQFHASPLARDKTVTEKVAEVADKVRLRFRL